MAVTEASPMLALPSAERPPVKNVYNLGVLLGGIGSLMVVAGLVAAWVSVGHFMHPWPPKKVDLSNYDGTMLVMTMIMSSITVEWGVFAARRSMRSQAATAFGITIGLGLAFLNLAWFFGKRLGFGPATQTVSPYAVLLFSMLAVAGIAVVAGVLVIGAVLARLLGQQVTGNVETARAGAWFWQSVVVGWVIIYCTVWLFS